AETLSPAVVNVRTTGVRTARADRSEPTIPEPFRRFLPPELRERLPQLPQQTPRPMRGLGTGFVIDPNGYVVTNHHVVDGAKTIEVTLSDGRKLTGTVVGTDPETDLALLKIEATGLPTIPLGDSSAIKVGEPVMAIGNPFGLDHTVTVGIVSGKSRVIGAGRYDDYLQTDAAINPGNSGGPLVNVRGEAVGIATAIASRTGGFQGVGFAIPTDLARPVLEQLRTAGKVTRGWLGVSIQPLTPELSKSFGLTAQAGALVASVSDASPASKAGLRPGDVIVRYDGQAVDTPRELSALVANTTVGKVVDLGVMRDGRTQPLQVTIGELAATRQVRAADEPGRHQPAADLGLELAPVTPELARRFGVPEEQGVVVTDVRPDSPAARATLSEGDVIREINRTPVRSLDDVEKGLRTADAQVLLRVEREGNARYVVIETS
ncbi:MAG: DegQ family serine endoprotease, partial [Candidatus Rokuibacteriota bacterium]